MLFVQHNFTEQFFYDILQAALDIGGKKFALWDDPCSSATIRTEAYEVVDRYFLDKEMLEGVTFYPPEEKTDKLAGSYAFTRESLDALIEKKDLMSQAFDSMSIYSIDSGRWIICMIFHEKMVMVKNLGNVTELLDSIGIKYSYDPPPWW